MVIVRFFLTCNASIARRIVYSTVQLIWPFWLQRSATERNLLTKYADDMYLIEPANVEANNLALNRFKTVEIVITDHTGHGKLNYISYIVIVIV